MNITHQNTPALLISAIALLSLLPTVASAEWGVGVSMETTQSMYKNNKSKGTEINVSASPSIEYRGERLKIHDGTLSYAVINTDKYAIDVLMTSKIRATKLKIKTSSKA